MVIAYIRPFLADRAGLSACVLLAGVMAFFVPLVHEVLAGDAPESKEPEKQLSDWDRVQLDKTDSDFKGVSDKEGLKGPLESPAEFEAFSKTILKAAVMPTALLERHARRGISYDSLLDNEQRPLFLRELINVKGRIRHPIARWPAVPRKVKEAGIDSLYSIWLNVPGSPNKEMQVVFCDLPEGLSIGERGNFSVHADGYFFKLLEYPVEGEDDGNLTLVSRFAPLIVARTLRVIPDEATAIAPDDVASKIKLQKRDDAWDSVRDKKPLVVSRDENSLEYNLYNMVAQHASLFSPEDLRTHSRKDFAYADLLADIRQQYLRELLHVKGTLVRLRKLEATGRLKATAGIQNLYEGWIIHESNESHTDPHMFQVVLTELPPGLEPGGKLNHKVAFDGYYFKLHGYETKEKNEKGENIWRMSPLLIGRSIEVMEPDPSPWAIANPVVPALMIFFAILIVGVFILMYWLRRSDRIVQTQAREALTKLNPFDNAPVPPIEPGSDWNRVQE